MRLNGHVRFDLDEGRLVSVDPGAGRLLGLLSVTALPRRFLLDFSDLTDSGLAFDSLSGSYALEEGVARTDNLRINGPSVRVEARGEVDLVQRVQDQRVTIYPGISHGLTAAATVLGGPAVGLFMLFAQELLDKPLDQVGQISYRLSGPLDNPQVEAPAMSRITVAAIQLNGQPGAEDNLRLLEPLLAAAREAGATMAVLPENLLCMGQRDGDKFEAADRAARLALA